MTSIPRRFPLFAQPSPLAWQTKLLSFTQLESQVSITSTDTGHGSTERESTRQGDDPA